MSPLFNNFLLPLKFSLPNFLLSLEKRWHKFYRLYFLSPLIIMFLVKLSCIFLDVLQSSEKTKFLSNGKYVLMETLTKASEYPVLNLTVGKKESPVNQAAGLAEKLVKREIEYLYNEIFEVFDGKRSILAFTCCQYQLPEFCAVTKPVRELSVTWAKFRK